MSSISRLDLSKAEDPNVQVPGFDETIGNSSVDWHDTASVTPHALAHKTMVCGTQSESEEWISWTQSFAPHRVCRVASNSTGTVIAATVDNGTVSILRGVDGTILATRRIAPEGVRVPAEVSFISGREENDDALLIESPEDDVILVSNIQGSRLNSVDEGVVSDAARSMVIHALKFQDTYVRTIRGSFVDKNILRLALVDGDGKLGIYDYNLVDKEMNKKEISSLPSSIEIDFNLGLRVHQVGSQTYLVASLSGKSDTIIGWFNLNELTVACQYKVSPKSVGNSKTKQRTRLLALEPLVSFDETKALAVVTTFKYPGDSKIETKILQAAISNDGGIGQVHELYNIPVPASVQYLAMAALVSKGPYSFRCMTSHSGDKFECHDFKTDVGSAIGSIRLLLVANKFDEAYNVVDQVEKESLETDPFAEFHPSEIALRQLEVLLSEGSLNDELSVEKSRQCLSLLAEGASGNKYGERALLSAAECVLEWPNEQAIRKNPPAIGEITMGLSGIIKILSSVNDLSPDFQKLKKELEEKFCAIKYLESILSEDVPMNSDFSSIRSIQDLFAMMIRYNYFLAAEHIWRSHLNPKLSTEVIVSAVWNIPPTVNPRNYAGLLKEIVFPILTINHELLPPLLAWSCKTADSFDDNNGSDHNLDDAIFLLETFDHEIKDLRLKIHSSFASNDPFVERHGFKKRRVSPKNDSLAMVSTLDSSFFSVESFQTDQEDKVVKDIFMSDEKERPNPSILELGRMKGGAQKSRSRKIASLEAMDESEECVESKLVAARCLKRARGLGLDRKLVNLRTFATDGGAQFISKELIRLYSSKAKTHEERTLQLSEYIQKFCKDSSVVFDEALMLYAKELCGGKNTSRRAIEESASLARCCITTTAKCQVVLVTLRAALFCRHSPVWLSELSREAIEWAAGDSSLRSELEEASRLLLIDGIVGRYCGDGAKELFHVDNPRHAIRLVDFVSRHFAHERVLSDILALCEAFSHLSQEDVCSQIIQNAILEGDEEVSASLLNSLYSQNVQLAKASFSRVISFCIDMIEEGSDESSTSERHTTEQRDQVVFVTSCAHSLTRIALANAHAHVNGRVGYSSTFYDESRLEALAENLMHLRTLQTEYNVFLSLSALNDPKCLIETASKFLKEIVEYYLQGAFEASRAIVIRAKRICGVLAGSSRMKDTDIWLTAVGSTAASLAKKASEMECLVFLNDLGVLDSIESHLSARCCLSTALSFCMKALKESSAHETKQGMKYIIMATSLLKDSTISRCPHELLGATVTIGELCDIISQILLRSDEGIGEEMDTFRKILHKSKRACSDEENISDTKESLLLHRPSLHPSWYVGDGLLLPPSETLIRGLDFCKLAIGKFSLFDTTRELYYFVEGRGAYALALRLLCFSSMTQMSQATPDDVLDYEPQFEIQNQTILALAERSLGGTGNGILSGVVDSEMATSCLLCLPLRHAFKMYKSSLPTAMSTRDFNRLRKLAGVGQAVGSGALLPSNAPVFRNWKRQDKFVAQCQQLALRAKWWDTLQNNNVKFDLHRFDEGGTDEDKGNPTKYASSLLPALIANMANTNMDTAMILQNALKFASAFGVGSETPIQHYLDHLLSPPKSTDSQNDKSWKVSNLEGTIKTLVRRLDSPSTRLNVLRKCLVRLEKSNDCSDYERLEVISAAYHTELASFVRTIDQKKIDLKPYLFDLELIDRRRDALAILSSYFQGDKRKDRPLFSGFFSPFPESLSIDSDVGRDSRKVQSRVLGSESKELNDSFDPLSPLDAFLSSSCDSAVTSALAPLCLALGVPRGYIHARSLIFRFKKSNFKSVALPSFESDILPVLDRLKSPSDVADIAEWCSLQYAFKHEDKLRSLDHAMNSAIQASNEVEGYARQNSRRKDKAKMNELESKALERVKRISIAKDLLVDRLAINSILSSVGITSEKYCAISSIVDSLMNRLDEQVWNKEEFIPESFVEIFLIESSLLAAEASLSRQQALSIGNFKKLCSLVHEACKSVAERYSHVQVGDTARKLARTWLVHGDELSSEKDGDNIENEKRACHDAAMSRLLPDIEEEDTMNFEMDLATLSQEENNWNNDVDSAKYVKKNEKKYTSEEESSTLKSPGCANESSEFNSQRASLRIAFVMSYADGYHESIGKYQGAKENTNPTNKNVTDKQKGRKGLLAKVGKRESLRQHDNVIEHSRELLRIVFAKSGSSNWGSFEGQKTITFAMRHRALRAASVLCPQEALEEVIAAEGFFKSSTNSSLKKSSFAAYVAKEIEELGLPLPHSDLSQLSTANFSSYARTLWRHHRDSKVSKGRFLLLVIEMYLRERISDYDFFLSILDEVVSSDLPRTLLLALESTKRHLERMDKSTTESFFELAGEKVSSAMKGLLGKINTEYSSILSSTDPLSLKYAMETSERFSALVKIFCHGEEGQQNLNNFVKFQLMILQDSSLPSHGHKDRLLTMIGRILHNAGNNEISKDVATSLVRLDHGNISAVCSDPLESDSDDPIFSSLTKFERSLNTFSEIK